jgi:hypothetical protein
MKTIFIRALFLWMLVKNLLFQKKNGYFVNVVHIVKDSVHCLFKFLGYGLIGMATGFGPVDIGSSPITPSKIAENYLSIVVRINSTVKTVNRENCGLVPLPVWFAQMQA